jgi:hypothetical protein
MEIKDLLITPILLCIVYTIAFLVRPKVTDSLTRKYFIPALSLKIIGAIALGLIYQYYYGGGDTFTYFNLGSKYIWHAFLDSPILAIKLIFAGDEYIPETYQYASKIYTYGDSASYFIVRIAGVFDIITLHTYSATAVLFAVFSFTGMWALFLVFYRQFPLFHKYFAIAVFFIPSLFFWGSGILKDSITIGALGWATYSIYQVFFVKKNIIGNSFYLAISLYILGTVKIYIVLCFLPAALFWIFYSSISKIRNAIIRIMFAPFVIAIAVVLGYLSIIKVSESDPRYNLETMAYTAQSTAEWIHYVSERNEGSAYTLGDFDYSPGGMVKKFPLAVWVTLYRPYVWEAHNIVMLFSALESLSILFLTLYVIFKAGPRHFISSLTTKPFVIFCFVFSIMFAFAVGVTTYNFGTLVRYKIPMIPFFVSGLFIIYYYSRLEKNRLRLP